MSLDSFYALAGAVIAGGVIGFEREWRGRAAGFRTHILVCLASALLMQAAMMQELWAFRALPEENIVTDPTRMAHGVLTGIGFLCAGVIFRSGFSIHGLTTAASLWITAAIGLLFGAGLYVLGLVGTVVTAGILVLLRLVSLRLPAQIMVDAEVSWIGGLEVGRRIEAMIRQADSKVKQDAVEKTSQGFRRTWRLKVSGPEALDQLAEELAGSAEVTAFSLDPRND